MGSGLNTSGAAPEDTYPGACLAAHSCACPAQEERRLPLTALIKERPEDEMWWASLQGPAHREEQAVYLRQLGTCRIRDAVLRGNPVSMQPPAIWTGDQDRIQPDQMLLYLETVIQCKVYITVSQGYTVSLNYSNTVYSAVLL